MVSVSFRCERCGTTIEWEDDVRDSTTIACKNCGSVAGTYGDLRNAAEDAVRAKIEGMIKDCGNGF